MLTDPTGADTCYVGASYNPSRRLYEHIKDGTSKGMRAWVKILSARGLQPMLNILDTCLPEHAVEAEIDAIQTIKAMRGPHCLNRLVGPHRKWHSEPIFVI